MAKQTSKAIATSSTSELHTRVLIGMMRNENVDREHTTLLIRLMNQDIL